MCIFSTKKTEKFGEIAENDYAGRKMTLPPEGASGEKERHGKNVKNADGEEEKGRKYGRGTILRLPEKDKKRNIKEKILYVNSCKASGRADSGAVVIVGRIVIK